MKTFLAKFKLFLRIYREEQLSDYFIELITNHSKTNEIDILDYGSGFNPVYLFLSKNFLTINSTPVSLC